ncbi:MAG: dethiobiotin synthase [Caulobacter sp.]|nr:dethiobiotin synthase [Caulobacter sp.]
MRTLFIAGAGTDVGKTWVTAALARALLAAGTSVAVFKPVASGYDPASPDESDAGRLLAALGREPTPEAIAEICPLRFAAPLSPPAAARREGVTLSLDGLVDSCRARIAAAPAEVLLIEGVGGLMSPVTDTATGLDLLAALDVPAILVGGTYLGGISHLLTAAEVLAARRLPLLAAIASESPPPAPDFAETAADLRRFLGATPLLAAGRNDEAFGRDLVAAVMT